MNSRICSIQGLLLLLLKNYALSETMSFVEKNILEKDIRTIYTEIEKIYFHSVRFNVKNNDILCTLSDEKKKELCKIVAEMKMYKVNRIYLSKIPLFKAKLPCIEREINLLYYRLGNSAGILSMKQKMYSCFYRHDIIRTSFIEDDYYDKFYISAGPHIRSVIIYNFIRGPYGGISLYDLIFNIDTSKLNGIFIREPEIVAELKLNKKLYVIDEEKDVQKIYAQEQKYLEHDLICNLSYERKITLCKVLFDQHKYKDKLKITLNKSASYIFNMNCVTKLVHNTSAGSKEILRIEQKMYSCQGKKQNSTQENLLTDEYVSKFYLSSGPKRNSVFVYQREMGNNYDEKFTVVQLIENIPILRLQPTFITLKELMTESSTTYAKINEIMETSMNEYSDQLFHIIIETQPGEMEIENEKINKIVERSGKAFDIVLEAARETKRRQIIEIVKKYEKDKSSTNKNSSEISYNANENINENDELTKTVLHKLLVEKKDLDFISIGPQVYKRILEKIRAQMGSGTSNPRAVKRSFQAVLEKRADFSSIASKQPTKAKNKKLHNDIQKLIENMEIFVLNINLQRIEGLAENVFLVKGNENKKNRGKEAKTKKKKK